MKEILTLNKIAKCGTDRFDSANISALTMRKIRRR